MRRYCSLAGLTLALAAFVLAADKPDAAPDPLRLVPEQAEFVLQITQPRRLGETAVHHDLVKQLRTLEAVQELYDSTNFRRFYQLLAHFEKEMGARWPEMLDRVAGGGIVVAAKFGGMDAPALLVVQSKDEAALRKFIDTAGRLLEDELARQEAKEKPEKLTYRNTAVLRVGKDFHVAVAGGALLVSNQEKPLQLAIDLHLDGGKQSVLEKASVKEARQLALNGQPDALAWMWLDADTIRSRNPKEGGLDPKATDPQATVLFGGWLDQFRRTPFLCGVLHERAGKIVLGLRTPCGREGMDESLAALHAPSAEQGGALPLLEPKGTLFSISYTLDTKELWERRAKLFNEAQLKDFEQFDKSTSPLIGGNKPSWLLSAAGPHHRFVAAHRQNDLYAKKPGVRLPAFAVVVAMRDPKEFTQIAETALRTAALAGLTQVKMKLVEEKHGGLKIVGYRFPDDAGLEDDAADIRFNFMPCFVSVGNQFVVSSTFELAHELVDLLQKEAKGDPVKSETAMRMRFYPSGAADYLQSVEDQLLAQTILDRAIGPKEARAEVQKLLSVIRSSGVLEIEQQFAPREFRYDFKYLPKR